MGIPARPLRIVLEGKESCVIGGRQLNWTNCTPASFAMAVSRSTLGAKNPSACDLRIVSGDKVGGTNLSTIAAAAFEEYGVRFEVRDGSKLATPAYLAGQIRIGRSVVAQGNTGALVRTSFRSTRGPVNHAVYVNGGRNWTLHSGGVWLPAAVLVFDPAADGRKAAWGTAATGPAWWPWATFLAFVAALRPWGDTDPRTLGPGKAYAALGPDTEPHVHLRYGGSVRTSPFPRTMTVRPPSRTRINLRSGPSTKYPVVRSVPRGAKLAIYQQNPTGQSLAGSRLWYGDHDGKLWAHSSGLR